MTHSIEVDQKTFVAARKLSACAELDAVRLTRCKVNVNPEKPISESNQVALHVTTKRSALLISRTSFEIAFDFLLTGIMHGTESKAIEIGLRLNATYRYPQDVVPEPSDIRAFGMTNGMLNVWPYWREFVQSITSRAGLPPLTVPLFRLKYNLQPKPTK